MGVTTATILCERCGKDLDRDPHALFWLDPNGHQIRVFCGVLCREAFGRANRPQVPEHPILYTDPMVVEILEGRKTHTRRPLNPQPFPWAEKVMPAPYPDGRAMYGKPGDWLQATADDHRMCGLSRCKFGQAGERLWVRECWGLPHNRKADGDEDWCDVVYRSTVGPVTRALYDPLNGSYRWRPSIHMPRWACRLVLDIKRIWVEWLQAISDEDARAEGVRLQQADDGLFYLHPTEPANRRTQSPRLAFQWLWEQCYGPASWDANPWVWGIEFERFTK